jgi:hypothetical protein
LRRVYPDLHAAHRLYEHGAELRFEVEARLLARQSADEIAASTRLLPPTIDAYEAIFFNVRDRLNAGDWVVGTLIGQGLTSGIGPWPVSEVWKVLASAGGSPVLDVVLAATSERPNRNSYPAELLLRVRRLVNFYLAPADLSTMLNVNAAIEAERPEGEHGRARRRPASLSLDKVVNEAAEIAAMGLKTKRSAPRTSCASPTQLGTTPNHGATVRLA